MKGLLFLPLAFAFTFAFGQQPSSVTIPLTDLSAFKPQAGNWQIVGNVTIDPTRDIHEHTTVAVPPSGSKKKNKKAPVAPAVASRPVVTSASGTGILVNL